MSWTWLVLTAARHCGCTKATSETLKCLKRGVLLLKKSAERGPIKSAYDMAELKVLGPRGFASPLEHRAKYLRGQPPPPGVCPPSPHLPPLPSPRLASHTASPSPWKRQAAPASGPWPAGPSAGRTFPRFSVTCSLLHCCLCQRPLLSHLALTRLPPHPHHGPALSGFASLLPLGTIPPETTRSFFHVFGCLVSVSPTAGQLVPGDQVCSVPSIQNHAWCQPWTHNPYLLNRFNNIITTLFVSKL